MYSVELSAVDPDKYPVTVISAEGIEHGRLEGNRIQLDPEPEPLPRYAAGELVSGEQLRKEASRDTPIVRKDDPLVKAPRTLEDLQKEISELPWWDEKDEEND